jgi:tetratricopeptide (TPR) repeat protein
MFSMMGYAVYQYHEEFGFDDVEEVNLADNGIDIKDAGISQDSFLNEIHILVSEGMQEEAIKRLKSQIRYTPQNMAYRDKYHNLLKISNNAKDITTHTEEYIKFLLKETKVHKGKIITIYTDCLKINPDYFYPDANVTADLAKTAQELFRNNDALSLLNKFAQNYPNSDQIPYAYFMVAQLLVDHKQQEAQAKKILTSILSKYPNHELTTKIKDYIVLIDKLKS